MNVFLDIFQGIKYFSFIFQGIFFFKNLEDLF